MSDTQRTTKPAEVELLPCPFCGGAPGVVHTTDVDDTKWVHVECYGCGARTRGDWIPPSSDQCPIFFQEVRAEWNRRANVSRTTAPLQAEIEALRAEVDALAKDAAKYRWGINNARWVRSEQEAYVAIPVAPDADLSCVAMRDAAIDAAMGKEASND